MLSKERHQTATGPNYVANEGEFGTHQGVKGLEFERVLVVLDDFSARGFLFNYEKAFGAMPLTPNDEKNIREGKDNSIDRTKRLLYVACTRAEESLALVAYSSAPELFANGAIERGWFRADEIEKI